ncbi:zinc-binding dehydrogenase, partial [Acinetobacter baumannii]
MFLIDLNAARLQMSADAVHPDAAIDGSTTDTVAKVLELTGGRGADVVITAAASGKAQEAAQHMLARGGRLS